MKRRAARLILILLALLGLVICFAPRFLPKPPVPTGQLLIHLYGPWLYPPPDLGNPSRTAPATILLFKADGQYVEHSCYVIDEGKDGLFISPGDGHVVAVGTWEQRGSTLTVRRERVARFVRYAGPGPDPLCRPSVVEYHLAGGGVRQGKDVYHASSQLRLNDWESYVSEAKRAGVSCRRVLRFLSMASPVNGNASLMFRRSP